MAGLTREEIVQQLRERILAFATSRTSREGAEDLVQDVMVVLHEKYGHVEDLTELMPLSFQMLRYKMLDRHRKMLRRGEYNQESLEAQPLVDQGDDPALHAEQKEQVTHLIAALLQLGERCRKLFRLKMEGYSFLEIQKVLGQQSINTIYTWDSRCRKELLALMGGQWEAMSMPRKGPRPNKETVG